MDIHGHNEFGEAEEPVIKSVSARVTCRGILASQAMSLMALGLNLSLLSVSVTLAA